MADKELNELNEEAVVEAEEVSTDTVEAESTESSKKSKKTEPKAKKRGFFSRIGAALKKFWKTMKSELKKVTWFSRKQTFTSTLLVLVVMAAAAIVIGLLDVGFSMGLEALTNLF